MILLGVTSASQNKLPQESKDPSDCQLGLANLKHFVLETPFITRCTGSQSFHMHGISADLHLA